MAAKSSQQTEVAKQAGSRSSTASGRTKNLSRGGNNDEEVVTNASSEASTVGSRRSEELREGIDGRGSVSQTKPTSRHTSTSERGLWKQEGTKSKQSMTAVSAGAVKKSGSGITNSKSVMSKSKAETGNLTSNRADRSEMSTKASGETNTASIAALSAAATSSGVANRSTNSAHSAAAGQHASSKPSAGRDPVFEAGTSASSYQKTMSASEPVAGMASAMVTDKSEEPVVPGELQQLNPVVSALLLQKTASEQVAHNTSGTTTAKGEVPIPDEVFGADAATGASLLQKTTSKPVAASSSAAVTDKGGKPLQQATTAGSLPSYGTTSGLIAGASLSSAAASGKQRPPDSGSAAAASNKSSHSSSLINAAGKADGGSANAASVVGRSSATRSSASVVVTSSQHDYEGGGRASEKWSTHSSHRAVGNTTASYHVASALNSGTSSLTRSETTSAHNQQGTSSSTGSTSQKLHTASDQAAASHDGNSHSGGQSLMPQQSSPIRESASVREAFHVESMMAGETLTPIEYGMLPSQASVKAATAQSETSASQHGSLVKRGSEDSGNPSSSGNAYDASRSSYGQTPSGSGNMTASDSSVISQPPVGLKSKTVYNVTQSAKGQVSGGSCYVSSEVRPPGPYTPAGYGQKKAPVLHNYRALNVPSGSAELSNLQTVTSKYQTPPTYWGHSGSPVGNVENGSSAVVATGMPSWAGSAYISHPSSYAEGTNGSAGSLQANARASRESASVARSIADAFGGLSSYAGGTGGSASSMQANARASRESASVGRSVADALGGLSSYAEGTGGSAGSVQADARASRESASVGRSVADALGGPSSYAGGIGGSASSAQADARASRVSTALARSIADALSESKGSEGDSQTSEPSDSSITTDSLVALPKPVQSGRASEAALVSSARPSGAATSVAAAKAVRSGYNPQSLSGDRPVPTYVSLAFHVPGKSTEQYTSPGVNMPAVPSLGNPITNSQLQALTAQASWEEDVARPAAEYVSGINGHSPDIGSSEVARNTADSANTGTGVRGQDNHGATALGYSSQYNATAAGTSRQSGMSRWATDTDGSYGETDMYDPSVLEAMYSNALYGYPAYAAPNGSRGYPQVDIAGGYADTSTLTSEGVMPDYSSDAFRPVDRKTSDTVPDMMQQPWPGGQTTAQDLMPADSAVVSGEQLTSQAAYAIYGNAVETISIDREIPAIGKTFERRKNEPSEALLQDSAHNSRPAMTAAKANRPAGDIERRTVVRAATAVANGGTNTKRSTPSVAGSRTNMKRSSPSVTARRSASSAGGRSVASTYGTKRGYSGGTSRPLSFFAHPEMDESSVASMSNFDVPVAEKLGDGAQPLVYHSASSNCAGLPAWTDRSIPGINSRNATRYGLHSGSTMGYLKSSGRPARSQTSASLQQPRDSMAVGDDLSGPRRGDTANDSILALAAGEYASSPIGQSLACVDDNPAEFSIRGPNLSEAMPQSQLPRMTLSKASASQTVSEVSSLPPEPGFQQLLEDMPDGDSSLGARIYTEQHESFSPSKGTYSSAGRIRNDMRATNVQRPEGRIVAGQQAGSAKNFLLRQGLIFSCLYIGYAMYVYNRRSFSFVLPSVVEQESLTSYELGLVFSAQHLAYAFSKLVAGVMSDQSSQSLMFSVGLFMSGMFSLAFVDSESLMTFVATSFANGLAQGFGWPPAAKILQQWFRPGQFGLWWGMLSTSMNVAAAAGHPMATFLAINHGWHVAIQMPAMLSMGFAVIFYIAVHNKPSECGYVDQLPAPRTNAGASAGAYAQWMDLFCAPFIWLLGVSYLVVFCIRTSVQDWMQLYLVHDLGQPAYAASAFLGAVETGGIAGTLVSGIVSDFLVRSMAWGASPRKSARMVILQAQTAGIAVCLNLLLFTVTGFSSYYWIVIMGFLIGFFVYGAINLFGVITMETAPAHLAGSAHAVVSFFANVGGVISGVPISLIARYFDWFGAFVLLEVACLAVFLTMLVLKDMPTVLMPQEATVKERNVKFE